MHGMKTCKNCKEPACGDCLWINSEDFKNCQHEEVQRVLGLGQYRCPHCGLLVGVDLAKLKEAADESSGQKGDGDPERD